MDYPYKLSIITVNLNNKDGLQKTIDSVINQTCQDFEWLIIDGGSTDGSKELIEKYSVHINYWVSEPDDGIYSAMNKGIYASKGEYLLFLNSGDMFYNNRVLQHASKYLKDKDLYIGREKRSDSIVDIDISDRYQILYTLCTTFFPHQSTFIKRSLFSKYGLFNSNRKIVSDWEFFLNLILKGDPSIKKIPFIVTIFNNQGISSTNPEILNKEREMVLNERPYIKILINFFTNYYYSIQKLRNKKILRYIGRICRIKYL